MCMTDLVTSYIEEQQRCYELGYEELRKIRSAKRYFFYSSNISNYTYVLKIILITLWAW